MKTASLLALGLCSLATTSQAAIVLNFNSATLDGNTATTAVTVAGDTTNPAVPAVITVSFDALGNASISSATSNQPAVSNNWTVTGSLTGVANTTMSFTINANGNTGNGATTVRQRVTTGLGVNGGNGGRIDAAGEFLNVNVNASSLSNSTLLGLTSIGYSNTNAQTGSNPDLILTKFDTSTITFADVHIAGNPATTVTQLGVSGVSLTGGSNGQLRFSQGDTSGGPQGYTLSTLTFDVVPEPASLTLAGLGAMMLMGSRKRSR